MYNGTLVKQRWGYDDLLFVTEIFLIYIYL